MSRKVLTLSDKKDWENSVRSLPEKYQDVFYSPEYYRLFETDKSKAECFIFTMNDSVIVYPYLKTLINGNVPCDLNSEYFDIEGAYGYNGFVSNSNSEEFLLAFAEDFPKYCLENNIIAEFTRFNPLFNNHLFARHLDTKTENINVVVDLENSEEELWSNSYEHAARKNINKAKRSGLQVAVFYGSEIEKTWIDAFYNIYTSTMERNMADATYFFNNSFFSMINKNMTLDSVFFFTLTPENMPVSAEVVLLSKDYAYSYLGGTLSQYYEKRPNNILKHEAILFLKKRGIKKFCLGGGIAPHDGIFKYKMTFSKNGTVDFHIGKRIHNLSIYRKICRAWENVFPDKAKKYTQYLLKYRLSSGPIGQYR